MHVLPHMAGVKEMDSVGCEAMEYKRGTERGGTYADITAECSAHGCDRLYEFPPSQSSPGCWKC